MSSSIVNIPKKLPLLTLAEEVLLPGCQLRITVTPANIHNFKLVRHRVLSDVDPPTDTADTNWTRGPIIGLLPKKYSKETTDAEGEHPDVSVIGTAAVVEQVMAVGWPQPTFTVLATGLSRIRVKKLVMEVPYPVGVVTVSEKPEKYVGTPELEEAANSFRTLVLKLLTLAADSSMHYYFMTVKRMVANMSSTELPDMCTPFFGLSYAEKLELLAAFDLMERYKVANAILMRLTNAMYKSVTEQGHPKNRTTILVRIMPKEGQVMSLRHKYPNLVYRGGGGAVEGPLEYDEDTLQDLYNKLKAAEMPPHAWKVALKEFQRLKRLTPSSPELPIMRSYLELMSDLPWSKSSPETLDISKAQQDLDADHYAMEKLKKRILEYLAVRQLKNSLRGPILCFVGPPGVGKTSIGRSIAHTLSRKFHRISLGGSCNQSDIRGHRRTYIGAMPGRIIHGLKTVGTNNPVMLLDEVDKLQAGVQGDPGAALLEVLDPEQNHTFHDHYLNVPFDLSQVMFIATANTTQTIPRALLDRMEVIQVDGYTHEEKLHIALRHLIPKQVAQHGLDLDMIQIPHETVKVLIKEYTREAGVRSLERHVGALCRDVAVKVAAKTSDEPTIVIDCAMLEVILGPAPFSETQLWSRLGQAGVAVGLSVTEVGGEVMLVEASKMDGDGELQLTGQLGSVMKESANLALSYFRTYSYKYGLHLDSEMFSRTDIHVHLPAGAVAKEGPSAGVALVTALVSLFSDRPVATDVAMTGEISLKGAVLPVGGVKAKVLAAHRAGITRVIIPDRNAKDLQKIPQEVKDELTFILVSHVDEAIQAAFNGEFPLSLAEQIQPIISKL